MPPKLTVVELIELFASFCAHPADAGELLDLLGLTPKRNAYYKPSRAGRSSASRSRSP